MDLNKIKHFQAVAKTLNISKACKFVHLSQPALSLSIQSLEHDLGIRLFERNNRGLILTEEGRKLFERSQLLLDWESETEDIINDLNRPKGSISIGTYTTGSSYLITPRLNNFLKQYPEININYDYSDTDEIINKIKNLELDCAIISEVPDDLGIEKIPFFSNELLLVASDKYKISNKINPSELSQYDFLSYPLRSDYCYREIDKKVGKFIKNIKITSTSFDTLKQSLLHGLGITFMPEYLITNELKNKKLRKIEIKGLKLPIQFSFITKKDRKLPKKVEVFKNYFLTPQ